jgi:hypothetical protein
VAQVQQVWNKFNARERMTATGAGIVIVAWIVGLVGSYGFGSSIVGLLGAIAVLVILYLKYAPNQSITWPAPIPLIVLVISAIVALLAVLGLLQGLQLLGIGIGFFGLYIAAVILNAIGAVLMVWGAWQEYQLNAPARTTPGSTGTTSPPPAPMAPPPPPPAQSPSDTDQLPPA